MAGNDLRLDCILRRGIELVRWSSSPPPSQEAKTRKELADEGFEGEFIPTRSSPAREETTPVEAASRKEHPSFSSTPQDLIRPVGGEAAFECTSAGTSDPEVKWYKDGRVLMANKDVRMTTSGNKHRLKLTNILRLDQGEYTCKIKGAAGTKSCSATLTIAEETRASPVSMRSQVETHDSKSPAKADPKDEPATFSQPLDKVTQAVSGQDVALTCRVRGQVTKVMWELNSKPLPKEARYFVSYDKSSDLHSLNVSKVTDRDAAKFACVAKLPDGNMIHTSTTLQVAAAADDKPRADEEQETKPRFIKDLEDVIVKDGMPLSLSCDVEGNPRPQIAWFRDGVEIFDSQDIQISMIGSHCALYISDVFPEDEGDYSCTATNSLGDVTSECYVVVDAPA